MKHPKNQRQQANQLENYEGLKAAPQPIGVLQISKEQVRRPQQQQLGFRQKYCSIFLGIGILVILIITEKIYINFQLTDSEKLCPALRKFNLWQLSTQQKKDLLTKYQQMPKKDIKNSLYMPIVQNYNQQIQPFLNQFGQTVEVVSFADIQMDDKHQNSYAADFKTKLNQRLTEKRGQRDSQKNNAPPYEINSQKSKITREQWFQAFQYLTLVDLDLSQDPEAKGIAQEQIKILQAKYQLDSIQNELPMCIITPIYGSNHDEEYIWSLQSIIQQNYNNYKVIIIDDYSSDGAYKHISRHLKWRNVSTERFIILRNTKEQSQLGSILYATHKYCDFSQIHYVINGNDELIGRQVFKVMNAVYQRQKMFSVYSSHIEAISRPASNSKIYQLDISVEDNFKNIKSSNLNTVQLTPSIHLKSTLTDFVLLIRPQSLQDEKGQFYRTIEDSPYYLAAIELSCEQVKYLPELFYLENQKITKHEDFEYNKNQDIKTFEEIKKQKNYRCLAIQLFDINANEL